MLSAAALVLSGGCASPLEDSQGRDQTSLRRSMAQAVGREMMEAQINSGPIVLERENRVEALNLRPEVMAELERMAGPRSYRERFVPDALPTLSPPGGTPAGQTTPADPRPNTGPGSDPMASDGLPLGPALMVNGSKTAGITLERAIRSTVEHNLDVQFARLTPAISEARLAAAEAAFDWVLFNNFQWNSQDEPRVQSGFGSSNADQRQVLTETLGVRRRTTSGGQFTVQHTYGYTDVNSPNLTVTPNPAYEPNITLQIDQPLLRNFGSDVALAQVRLSQNADRDAVQDLKSKLIKAVQDSETAYWSLLKSQYDVRILKRLVDESEKVRAKLEARKNFDVKPSTYSDAVSKVQQRKAQLIQAQRNLAVASNTLKNQLNDPEYTVGSEVTLLAADEPVDAPVRFSLADAFVLAVQNRPEVQRALLSIDDTSIRLQLSDNARLPLLDLRFQTRFSGLGANVHDSYDSLFDQNFVDFLTSVNFEQPIGNREAEANFRVRRIEQQQAVIAYRNTVKGVVNEVRNALVDVVANYDLIDQSRAARYAAAENLRTLLVEEENIPAVTSEFLNLKLQRQLELAQAERTEIASMADYNNALAQLYSAMGTSLQRNRIKFDAPDIPQRAPTSPVYPAYPLP